MSGPKITLPFGRVALIGMGLIGSSLARVLRRKGLGRISLRIHSLYSGRVRIWLPPATSSR